MPGGRPSKYDPSFGNRAIEYMGQGFSKEAFAGHLGIAKQTLYNWMAEYPEFLDAIKHAETACLDFWERQGMHGMFAEKFGQSIWIFNMKARFGWKEAQSIELSGPDGKPIETKDVSKLSDDQLNARLAELISKQSEPKE